MLKFLIEKCNSVFVVGMGWFLILLLIPQIAGAKADAGQEGEKVVAKFLQFLQREVITELEEKVQTHVDTIDCFENPQCSSAEDILNKYREYRIYVGVLQYEDLQRRLQELNQAYIVYSGVRLHYSLRNEEGREEWEIIQEVYGMDQESSERQLASLELTSDNSGYYSMLSSLRRGSSAHYASIVSEYLSAYPFFGQSRAQSLSRQQAIELIERSGQDFERVMHSVRSLEGRQRFELMGFISAMEKAADRLSENETTIVINFIQSLNNETRLWGKIKKIFTNSKMLALGTCHVSTFALAAVPHPVVQVARLGAGFICSSIGVTLTVRHLGKATVELVRQLQYRDTRNYSDEMIDQYLRSYFTTLVMSMLYVVPALPGLKGRAQGIGENMAVVERAYRMNRLSLNIRKDWRFDRVSFASDVKKLGRSYAQYYGEELAVNTLLSAGGHYFRTVMQFERVILTRGLRSAGATLNILPFASLLT